jgi:hypothetical protein
MSNVIKKERISIMTNDPLAPEAPIMFKKIGSKYFRFKHILAVDDTKDEYLVVHFAGGSIKIYNENERHDFMQWFTEAAKYVSAPAFRNDPLMGRALGAK